ncbi:DUF4149 domain-containing protein [Kinneretia asaccharophila]|uniref:Uncharacterized protein DUF4149 n=1 Tax=Roseateles asaccharophilus TaxID=582607 RepID=A0A4R6N9C7_9BURK|nr:DUF4149 domain-containing protein [Roseateles asaccharophilus]MDN3543480.1 DUF4149 domain-containing protein [Roseateles asaccharophilus]TDP12142.1 uncharacterized protein DUF4149 [Roseateles asaccharophilus]
MLQRAQALLAALWGGLLLCVAGLAAPNAFAVLERAQAGAYVGRLFSLEAHTSLALGLLLMMMARRLARDGQVRTLSPDLLLPAGALFCTVAGYFALQPMMAAARAGQGALSFATLHGISLALFGLKIVLVLALAWRASSRR